MLVFPTIYVSYITSISFLNDAIISPFLIFFLKDSIMQYDSQSFAKEPEEEYPTLLTKEGNKIVDAEDFAQVCIYL